MKPATAREQQEMKRFRSFDVLVPRASQWRPIFGRTVTPRLTLSITGTCYDEKNNSNGVVPIKIDCAFSALLYSPKIY